MSSSGTLYTRVSATTANSSAAALNSSGTVDSLVQFVWTENGITNIPWNQYWDATPIGAAWESHMAGGVCASGAEHTSDANGLTEHLAAGHSGDVTQFLASWGSASVASFIVQFHDQLTSHGCYNE